MIKKQRDALSILRTSKLLIATKLKAPLFIEFVKTILCLLSFPLFNIFPKIINTKKKYKTKQPLIK